MLSLRKSIKINSKLLELHLKVNKWYSPVPGRDGCGMGPCADTNTANVHAAQIRL
jgi:hypothetical protein